MNKKGLISKIKAQRQHLGMTKDDLVKLCKTSPPHICRIENGHSSPKLKTLLKIYETLLTSMIVSRQENEKIGPVFINKWPQI